MNRRKFLIGCMPFTMAGCFSQFERKQPRNDTSAGSPHLNNSATPTNTETRTGFRPTPYTPVSDEPYEDVFLIKEGGGDISVRVFSDYAQSASHDFWVNTFDNLYWARVNDKISVDLYNVPKPVNKWSMFLPSTVYEVGSQLGFLKQIEYHHRLYEELYPDYSIRDIEVLAGSMGADEDDVIKAGKQRKGRKIVHTNREWAEKNWNITEPLEIVVADERIEDTSAEAIKAKVEEKLENRD